MKVTTLILGILIILLLSSCGFYQPSLVDMPLIQGKKDLHVDVGGSILPSVYTTVSYGLTNSIAVQTFAKISGDGKFYVQGAFGLYKSLSDNRVLEYNTAENLDHWVNISKTIKFTHYESNKKKAQRSLQGPGGY